MKKALAVLVLLVLVSCKKDKPMVDAIVFNAKVYTVNEQFDIESSFAVKDGKFLSVGLQDDLLDQFDSDTLIDAQGQVILPGLIDAHCHFLSLGQLQHQVNLVGTTSFDDMMVKILDFHNSNNLPYIKGRGWDQNDWEDRSMPTKTLLDKLFPNTPVALTRIDGHAALCNQAALDLGNVTIESTIEGGEVEVKNGQLTGMLFDNAEQLVMNNWPIETTDELVDALKKAQDICVSYGLTSLTDAGPDIFNTPWIDKIQLLDSLQKSGDISIRLNMMVPGLADNMTHFLKHGVIKTDRLSVRSFKFYADGALGSRGALLRAPYSDQPDTHGLPVMSLENLESSAERIANSEFQMNTHAIGDSANHQVILTYKKALKGKKDRRWRIEHAQVVSEDDFQYFDDILPSVQPTHCTSDMYWAKERLGDHRIDGAYAYRKLLDVNGRLALGTDFPVEQVSPFLTFYAAVARTDLSGFPEGGYHMDQALTREETLKGMTIWAAFASFEENEKGSIEPGKFADFIILDKDIMEIPIEEIPNANVLHTYIDGVKQ